MPRPGSLRVSPVASFRISDGTARLFPLSLARHRYDRAAASVDLHLFLLASGSGAVLGLHVAAAVGWRQRLGRTCEFQADTGRSRLLVVGEPQPRLRLRLYGSLAWLRIDPCNPDRPAAARVPLLSHDPDLALCHRGSRACAGLPVHSGAAGGLHRLHQSYLAGPVGPHDRWRRRHDRDRCGLLGGNMSATVSSSCSLRFRRSPAR